MPRALRWPLLALLLLAGLPARAAPESAPQPWKPPVRFAAIWLEGGAFFPSLAGARAREQVALGLAFRPLPFASVLAEGGWLTRDLPSGDGGRSLVSRGATLGLKVHHAFGSLEPGLLAGVSLWRSELSAPVQISSSLAGAQGETASSTGLVLGADLDWLLSDTMALALDWRWHRARASFPVQGSGVGGAGATRLDLGGHAAGLALRLYWP